MNMSRFSFNPGRFSINPGPFPNYKKIRTIPPEMVNILFQKFKSRRGGNVKGTRFQRGKKEGGKFSINDLNPVKYINKTGKAIRKSGTNMVKNKIEKTARKKINKTIVKQGKRINMSKKAADKLTDAITYSVREQLDRKIK